MIVLALPTVWPRQTRRHPTLRDVLLQEHPCKHRGLDGVELVQKILSRHVDVRLNFTNFGGYRSVSKWCQVLRHDGLSTYECKCRQLATKMTSQPRNSLKFADVLAQSAPTVGHQSEDRLKQQPKLLEVDLGNN